jgi:hypothetical protein
MNRNLRASTRIRLSSIIARALEGALDWMRNDGVSPDDADLLPDFTQIESIPVSRRKPEERKDADDLLPWIQILQE